MDPADDARLTGKYAKRPAVGKPAARKPAAGKLTERPETVTRSQPATGDKGRSPRNFSGQRALTRPSAPASKSSRPASVARPAPASDEPIRIAKALARAGLCSRRDAERWIAEGRVRVNGKRIDTPAVTVKPSDRILVDGKPLPAAEPVQLWRYHKPKGLVTTHRDPEGRPTVFDNLPADLPRVVSIGRLDFNTEGLLLLTNDGALARHLELPTTGWLRRYRVRAHGRVTAEDLAKLSEGVEIEGVRYGPVEATLDSVQGANTWLTLGLREGKNREVRKILASLGLEVNRLIRISYGPFQLLDLPPGAVEPVRRRVIADQLGSKLMEELGLNDVPDPLRAGSGGGKSREGTPRPASLDPATGDGQ